MGIENYIKKKTVNKTIGKCGRLKQMDIVDVVYVWMIIDEGEYN